MKRHIAALTMVLLAAGCAKRPDAIPPAAISDAGFLTMECAPLLASLDSERRHLATLSAAQEQAATGDAVGVFLIGVPTASLIGGDKEGEIAVAKGSVLAIESAVRAKGCTTAMAAPPAPETPAALPKS